MDLTDLVLLIMIMGPILIVFGYNFGNSIPTKETREKTVIFCNQKPQECKKEFEMYQLKKQVENFKMEELK